MRNRKLRLALNVLVVLLFIVLALAPSLGYSPTKMSLASRLAAPSALHPLGTDSMGRDLAGRLGGALRSAVIPMWGAVLGGMMLGMAGGFAALMARGRGSARYFVGGFDVIAAVIASIPVGLSAFAWSAWREEAGLGPVVGALAALFAVRAYLQLRDLHRHDRELMYWQAHEAMGGSLAGRIWRYGLASAWRRALVSSLGFNLRVAVAIEASLSYLGFGVQEPTPSFGNLLAAHFELYLKGEWHVLLVVAGGLALAAATPASAVALFPLLRRRGLS